MAKKGFTACCMSLLLSFILTSTVLADGMNVYWDTPVQHNPVRNVNVKINGELKSTKDIEPIITNGRVFVPVTFVQRFFAETMSIDDMGVVSFDGDKVVVDVNTGEITRYGLVMINDFPPYARQNTIMVPLRTMALAFNFDIVWDASTHTALLTRHSANDVDRIFISHY